jgi:transposase-like protein
MRAALLQRVIDEEGSIRKAARVLEIPRSTLSAWVRKIEPEPAPTRDAAKEPDWALFAACERDGQQNDQRTTPERAA